jgi:hypothetical protein
VLSLIDLIDLYADSSSGVAFIPQCKNTSAFGLVVLCHPTIIWIVPVEEDRSPDELAFAISSPRIWAKLGAKRKEL